MHLPHQVSSRMLLCIFYNESKRVLFNAHLILTFWHLIAFPVPLGTAQFVESTFPSLGPDQTRFDLNSRSCCLTSCSQSHSLPNVLSLRCRASWSDLQDDGMMAQRTVPPPCIPAQHTGLHVRICSLCSECDCNN